MGILRRFKNIMNCNIQSIINKWNTPEKDIKKYLNVLELDLNSVQAETNALRVLEQRARRELEECELNIIKFKKYEERALESGDERGRKLYLGKKVSIMPEYNELKGKYDLIKIKSDKLNQLNIKLTSDIELLKDKLNEAEKIIKSQLSNKKDAINSIGDIENKVEQIKATAIGLEEINSDKSFQEDNLDAEFKALLGEDIN